MAFIIKDRVKEGTTSTGTGAVSLGGAAATFDTFQSYMSNGDTTYYAIVHTTSGTDEWEVGLGTWNTGNTLTRTTVLAGSNGTSAVNFSAGTKDIFMTYPAAHAALAGDDVNFANITVTGTVDGRDVAADGSKLDTVEQYADVTDTVNVAAAGALMKSGGTMTGNLILNADPTTALGAATKEYVDTIAAAGIHYHTPVRVETPSALTATYDNGTSGVGATLTNSGTQAALVIDGVTVATNDRVLVYNQTNAAHNGIYTVTNTGSSSTNWVLTRATDADSYGVSDPDAFGEGDAFFVKEGDTGAGELYVMNTSGTITFGTTAINFTVIAETAVYSAGTGISLDGTTFSIGQDVGTTANVTFNQVTAAIIGNVTGNLTGDVTGNADTASALATARTIQLSGDVTGSATFDGSANINITAAVQDDSHAHVISNVDGLQAALDAKADDTTTITAGNGLTGGGSLGANRTLNVGAGGGITVSADAVAHADTSSQASVNNSGNTFIQDVTLDTYGHVTGLTSSTVTVGDATITVASGGGLTGSGDFTTNQGTNETITLSHADTSSQASVNNSGRTYIQDITLDTYGHITGITSATETVTNTNQLTTFQVEDGDGTEVTISHGKEWKFVEGGGVNIDWTDTTPGSDADPYDLTFTINTGVTAGSGLTGGGTLNVNRTISHADTSTQASVNNSNGTVIQDITLDGFGHITGLASVNLDGRYYTETEADSRFPNVQATFRSGAQNMDSFKTSGFHSLYNANATGHTNAPFQYGTMLSVGNTAASGGMAMQLAHERLNNGTYIRGMNDTNDTWYSWQRIFMDNYHPNADKWTTARTLSLSGDASGSVSWDGSANATLSVTVANDSHTHDGRYYTETESDARYEPINGTILHRGSDITSADWNGFIDGTEASWNTVLNMSGSNKPSIYTYGTALSFSKSGQAKFQLYANEQASGGGTTNGGLVYRTGWNTTYRAWRKIWDDGNDGSGSGLDADLLDGVQGSSFLRSDADDSATGFIDFTTGAQFGHIYVGGTSSANSSYDRTIKADDSSGLYLNYDGGGAVITNYTNSGGYLQDNQSVRAPIFYDSNNTAYYGDFASTSSINNIRAHKIYDNGGSRGLVLGNFSTSDTDQWPLVTWASGTGYDEGLIHGSSSRGVFSRSHFGIHFDDDRSFGFHTSSWDTEMEICGDGRIYQKGPVGIGGAPTTSGAKLTVFGGSAAWSDGGNQGTTVGSIHLDPENSADHYGSAITWGASDSANGTNAHAGIYVRSDGSYGTKMYLSTTDSYAIGSKSSVKIDQSGHVSILRGNLYTKFIYDSDNTGYYLNPASSSSAKFRQYVNIGDSSSYSSNSGTWGARLNVVDNVHARIDVGQDANSMLSSWWAHTGNSGPIFGTTTAHPMRMMYNGSEVGWWSNDYLYHNSDMRSPIFYDSDNTGYYLNPASTSNVNRLNANELQASNNTDANGLNFRSDNEVISGEGWCTAFYGYNNNDGHLFLARDSSSNAHPVFHIGGYNNAGYGPWSDADSMITLVRANGTKTTGSSYADKGLSNSSDYSNIVKTSLATIFRDSDGKHQFTSNVDINPNGTNYTSGDNTRLVGSYTTNRLHVNGSIQLLNNNDAIVIGRGTASFFTDEEIGFGWGGGWYMTDGTYLRVRNNKIVYSTGDARFSLYYDSNNTSYYVDPASTSNLNNLTVAGTLNANVAKDGIFWENNQTVTSNYTITNGKNAMSAGPITVNSGVTVTVGDGEAWTVV